MNKKKMRFRFYVVLVLVIALVGLFPLAAQAFTAQFHGTDNLGRNAGDSTIPIYWEYNPGAYSNQGSVNLDTNGLDTPGIEFNNSFNYYYRYIYRSKDFINARVNYLSSYIRLYPDSSGVSLTLGPPARSVTFTVTDGSSPVEGCTVTVIASYGGDVTSGTGTTNAGGEAVISLLDYSGTSCIDNGGNTITLPPYSYTVAKAGYAAVTGSIVLAGADLNETVTLQESPNLTIDYAAETIPGLNNSYEYSTDNFAEPANTQSGPVGGDLTLAVAGVEPGTADKHLYIRRTGTAAVQNLLIPARPATPTAHTIDYAAETTGEAVPATEEYATNAGFTADLTTGGGAAVSLTPGTDLWFRTKATGTAFASLGAQLTVPNRPAAPALSIDFSNERITNVTSAYEYAANAGFTGSATGSGDLALTGSLAPNAAGGAAKDLYIRVRAAAPNFVGPAQHLSIPARPATPAAHTIDYAAETTGEAAPATEEYATNAGFTAGLTTGGGAAVSLTPGTDLWFRTKATGTAFASLGAQLTVAARPATPAAHTIDYAAETTGEAVPATEEYATNAGFTTGLTTGGGAAVSLTPGTNLWFRTKTTGTAFASLGAQLVVAARPAAPTLAFDDSNNTISGLDGNYEYKIDDGGWTPGTTAGDFSGTKTVAVRLKATNAAFAGENQTINFTADSNNSGGGGNSGGSGERTLYPSPLTNPITEDDKALDKSLKETGVAIINVTTSPDNRLDMTPTALQQLAADNKPLNVQGNGVLLVLTPSTISTAVTSLQSNQTVQVGAKEVSQTEKQQLLAAAPLGQSTGIFEIGGKVFDLTAQVVTSGGNGGASKITSFAEPVAVTVNLADLNLTPEQISQLCGTRLERDAQGHTITVSLGGTYNAATKTFTFYTDKFSFYTVLQKKIWLTSALRLRGRRR